MRVPYFLLLAVLSSAACAAAQVSFVADSYFPADQEFQELQKTAGQESFEDPALLAKVADGTLFKDVGFEKYSRRVYKAAGSEISIEVVTLIDSRAAFSLLTILRSSNLEEGPPGDRFAFDADTLRFAQGRNWIRIEGRGAPADLLRRIAISMSNRIGSQKRKPPSLISHFPNPGYDPSSLRYFVGPDSFKAHSETRPGGYVEFASGMELAQARYSLQNQTGILSLSIFPTTQVAEGYYSELAGVASKKESAVRTYAKRAGPLVAILEGSFEPAVADRILDSLQYSYSIRWIYEKPKGKTVWGIPTAILGSVVNSLLFVALLCVTSIVLGAGYAIFRVILRGHAPNNPLDRPERTEITRLKMR